MTRLVGGACIERDVLTIDLEIVEIVVEAGNGSDVYYAIETPKVLPRRGVSAEVTPSRVEARHRSDRLKHESDPAEMATRYGAGMPVLDSRERLVCSRCVSRNIDMVVTGTERR
jgi:hypothetical protein